MPTRILRTDDDVRRSSTWRVDGEMLREDAELLRRLVRSHRAETGNSAVIDVADLDFLDSESAAILAELARTEDCEITGTEIFLQTVVNEAERHH